MTMHDTDITMKKFWLCLMRDAKSACDLPVSDVFRMHISENDIPAFRQRSWPNAFQHMTPYQTKWRMQMEGLFKRYRFQKDSFSDEELSVSASQKFWDDQLRISTPLTLQTRDLIVIRRARRILSDILGVFDKDEHSALCQFSERANYGVKYRESYLDRKLAVLSGTPDQIAWFSNQLLKDKLLDAACKQCSDHGRATYVQSDRLNLAKVPKSYKAVRTMLPNTVIGSFYSAGIGNLITSKLLDVGLDIRRLQQRHKILAKKFSVSRSHVTADLKSASDSFNRELLRRLLPCSWYKAITFGLPRLVSDDGKTGCLSSVMTMGMGHTFPLQTLLFYSLLRAVQSITETRGLISVYGDDLIYPRQLHRYVTDLFPRLNLQLNHDKTFVTSHFRESCGGDYCHGVDVRPFQPEGTHQLLSNRHYTAFLYKLYNGLLLRWDACEVSQALHYLMVEICNVTAYVHQVPDSYSASAGIYTDAPRLAGFIPWSRVVWNESLFGYTFHYLTEVAEKRIIECETAYYWNALRRTRTPRIPCLWSAPQSSFYLRKSEVQPVNYRSVRGMRIKKLALCEDRKGSASLRSQTGSTSVWTADMV